MEVILNKEKHFNWLKVVTICLLIVMDCHQVEAQTNCANYNGKKKFLAQERIVQIKDLS
jgi:hypothetical protein